MLSLMGPVKKESTLVSGALNRWMSIVLLRPVDKDGKPSDVPVGHSTFIKPMVNRCCNYQQRWNGIKIKSSSEAQGRLLGLETEVGEFFLFIVPELFLLFWFCSGSGSGSACFRTALRRRTFGFSAGSEDFADPDDRVLEDGTEVGAEETEVETGAPPPKVEVGGTKGSLASISFSTRFASSEATTELPEPNSEREGDELALPSALSIEKEPNPSSSFFLDFFGAGLGFDSVFGWAGSSYEPVFFALATSFRT